MENGLMIEKKGDLLAAIDSHGIGEVLKPLIKEIYLLDTFVAGTTYIPDKTALSDVKTDDKLVLKREDNKFDENAILVLLENGKKLGYVPEKDNLVFARLMDAGKLLNAVVKEIKREKSYTQIRIGINLVDF